MPVLRDADNDWEPYALDMLAGVLDGNEAARLNRNLVREQTAGQFGQRQLRQRGARPRHVLSERRADSRQDAAGGWSRRLRRELEKIADEGVTDEELKRVKAQVIAGQVYERDSMFSQARRSASWNPSVCPTRISI